LSEVLNASLRSKVLRDSAIRCQCCDCGAQRPLSWMSMSAGRVTTYSCPACGAWLLKLTLIRNALPAHASGYVVVGFEIRSRVTLDIWGAELPNPTAKCETIVDDDDFVMMRCPDRRSTVEAHIRSYISASLRGDFRSASSVAASAFVRASSARARYWAGKEFWTDVITLGMVLVLHLHTARPKRQITSGGSRRIGRCSSAKCCIG
jgi:hypothetical protein